VPQVTHGLMVKVFAKLMEKQLKNLNVFGRAVPVQKGLKPGQRMMGESVIGGVLGRRVR